MGRTYLSNGASSAAPPSRPHEPLDTASGSFATSFRTSLAVRSTSHSRPAAFAARSKFRSQSSRGRHDAEVRSRIMPFTLRQVPGVACNQRRGRICGTPLVRRRPGGLDHRALRSHSPTKSRLRIVPRPETFPGEEAKPAGATRQARTLRLLLLVPVAHDAPCDEGEHGGPCEGCYDRGHVSAGAFV